VGILAILEKEILITLNAANMNYYESIGYKIPKIKTKWGKISTPRGTTIIVKIKDLSQGSHAKVTKVCDDCGENIPNKKYADILNERLNGDGKDRCFKCARTQAEMTKRLIVPYEKSLENYAKTNNKEYLLNEFSLKNQKSPLEIHYSSNDRYWWVCSECNSEFDAKINNRTSGGCNCPYCTGQKVNSTNCLWTTNPEVAKLLTNIEVGYEITSGSGSKAQFTCPDCGDVDEKNIKNVVTNGHKCLKCSDGFSIPEKFMICLLSQLQLAFKTQKTFNWSIQKRYDFYIPSLNLIIETHGEQHYSDGTFNHLSGKSLKDEQQNDKLKENLAHKNGIEKYIVINCSKSELEFLKESILKSNLSVVLNLSNIDWIKCFEYACGSLVKSVCELWNNTKMSTGEIGKYLNLDYSTIRRYLQQGTSIGMCEYDRHESAKRSSKLTIQSTKKRVIQLTKDNEFIKEWESIADASRNLNAQRAGIIMVCKRKMNSSAGFKWCYADDYYNGNDKIVNKNHLQNVQN
jgi:predicted transcriptional regulator